MMMMMMMKTCCCKLAVLAYFKFCCDDLHRSPHGAAPHCCYIITAAACAVWCAARSHARKHANSLHHLHRPTGFISRGYLLSHCTHAVHSLQSASAVNVHVTKTRVQHVGFTWKCDANRWLYCVRASIKVEVWSVHLFCFTDPGCSKYLHHPRYSKYLWLNESK